MNPLDLNSFTIVLEEFKKEECFSHLYIADAPAAELRITSTYTILHHLGVACPFATNE